MPNNSNQNISEENVNIVTLGTMGTNMKEHYQKNESTFMGSKGKASATYKDGDKNVQLSFRKQADCVLITKIIKPPFQNRIVLREKLMLH
jgi:hypothetical protein